MEYFQIDPILGTEKRQLPAATYNLMRTLFHQCNHSCLFVPVRSVQYQAIIDETEVAFVYAHRRSHIEFSWRHFKPQLRESLNDPVPYEFVYYDQKALETMQRMQGEFHLFAQQMYERNHDQNLDAFSHEKIIDFNQALKGNDDS